jgi:hypothetical protein
MYRRPQVNGSIQNPPRDTDGKIPAENLSEMLGRVSETSMGEIDNLAGEFQRLREKLRSDGERIQREIEEYTGLSKQVTKLTQIIYESIIRASVTH